MSKSPHSAHPFSLFVALSLFATVFLACACATSPPEDAAPDSASVGSDAPPDITPEKIRQHVIGEQVRDVPEENNAAEPIDWRFIDDEPKEFNVVEKQMDGERATVVIDMQTRSTPDARNQRRLAGRLRLHYELQTGWVTRQWEIVEIENISMKYKNESSGAQPKAKAQATANPRGVAQFTRHLLIMRAQTSLLC